MLFTLLTAIDCGTLPAPDNGEVDLSEGSLLGAMATYSCDPSYSLVGMSSRQCQENETWSGEAPTCEGNVKDQHFHVTCVSYFTLFTRQPLVKAHLYKCLQAFCEWS